MVNKISFKNYKLFKKEQQLEIKPFTILFGKNNTGKSALLKLPTLVENSLAGKIVVPFELINNGVRIGNTAKDIVYGKGNKAVVFTMLNENQDFLKVELRIYDDIPKIDSWNYNNELKLTLDEKYYRDEFESEWNAVFGGFDLQLLINKSESISSGDIPNVDFSLNTDYLSCLRQEGLMSYFYKANSMEIDKSGVKGENLINFLIEDSQTTDKYFFQKISDWIKENFEGWEIRVEMDSGRLDKPVLIFLEKDNLKVNLSDTGTGITQSLPLIIRSFKPCSKETLIIIEEPESHLHPYAHAQLAQLFANSIKEDSNKKYLIETHSQNFILRLRRLVAEGQLRAQDLALYYVDFKEEENESELIKINVTSTGGVDFWPENIFGETTIETRAIYNAQLNDLKNVD